MIITGHSETAITSLLGRFIPGSNPGAPTKKLAGVAQW